MGRGAIGSALATALADPGIPGCAPGPVLVRRNPRRPAQTTDLATLCAGSDVVVEAAGQAALAAHGETILAAGCDLLVVSVGALADDALRGRLLETQGRLLVSTGAIGGLDILRAAHLAGPLGRVRLTSTKPARAVIEDWMADGLRAALTAGRTVVFDGSAREAVRRFPRSVNVAATLAVATVGFDQLEVAVLGDPDADRVEHHVEADGPSGEYEFRFRNRPSATNPRTSAVTPYALVRALRDRHGAMVVI